jgi:DNA-binding transcriptional LysR family regulator
VNLRQLRYFVAIAEEGSLTRAARRLYVAQPSISQQIKALEAELGGALLERIPTGVRLTAAGKAFLVEARAALHHADRAASSTRSVLGLQSGELEIATVTSMAYGILPGVFARWQEAHPGPSLRLREYNHRDDLYAGVRDGVGDLAVGPRPAAWSGPVFELGWEEFLLILPSSDPLAGGTRPIDLATLADRDWVMFHPDHGLSELIRFACAQVGFTPRAAVQTGQVASAAHLAAAGLGVTLLPDNVVPGDLAASVRHLRSPIVRKIAAFTRQDPPPLARAFLHVLGEHGWRPKPRNATVIA